MSAMMISPQQIKAARAMLDWTQDMLAQEAGVSPATIFNFEKGNLSFSGARKIRRTLENKGFEFIGTQGINRMESAYITYSGSDGCHKFYDDMVATAENYGGEIAVVYKSPKLLLRSLGIPDPMKLGRLKKLSSLARIKCLLSNCQDADGLAPLIEVRAIPQYPLEPLATFVCGNSFAIIVPSVDEMAFHVRKSAEIANSEMISFMQHWKAALPLVVQSATKHRT